MNEEGEQSVEELAAPVDAEIEQETEETVVDDEEIPEEGEEVEPEPEDDSEEIDHNGEKYKIPKALKDAFLMQQDYTKKTQEVAEARKQFEAQQQEFQQRAQFQQAHIQEVAALHNIEAQLSQFQNVDWQALIEQDPVEAMKLDRQYQSLKEAHQGTVWRIQQAQQHQALETQQMTAKQIEQSREALARELKDWSPEVSKEVTSYLKSYERLGLNEQVLKDIHMGAYGPLPIIWARKAQLYDQLTQKAAAKPTQAPPPQPVTKVGAKATVTKDVSQMTDKEFAAWRQRQIKQRS
jgi:DNA repair exonuclease SbcCD ATPase subunit